MPVAIIGDSISDSDGHHYVVRRDGSGKPIYFAVDGIEVNAQDFLRLSARSASTAIKHMIPNKGSKA